MQVVVIKVTCPKCRSDQCAPTFFRDDAQCMKCGAEFNMSGRDGWWDKVLRRLVYPYVQI